MNPVIKILISTIAIVVGAWLLPGVQIQDFLSAIVLAIILAVLNSYLKPILILFTLPVTVVTLGLFLLVINAIIILVADRLMTDFHVDGFWWALAFSLVLSATTSILERWGQQNINL